MFRILEHFEVERFDQIIIHRVIQIVRKRLLQICFKSTGPLKILLIFLKFGLYFFNSVVLSQILLTVSSP